MAAMAFVPWQWCEKDDWKLHQCLTAAEHSTSLTSNRHNMCNFAPKTYST
jgi:hypothetical protein